MEGLSLCISPVLGLIAFLTLFTFYKAIGNNRHFLLLIAVWSLIQFPLYFAGTQSLVIVMTVALLPPSALVIWLMTSQSGKAFLYRADLHLLTVIHVVRAPSQVVLYAIFLYQVPAEVSFDKSNVDIIAGITAPLAYYVGILRGKVKWRMLVVWNVAGLVFLINFVFKTGPLNASFPFFFFPAVIVPVIACSHIVSIRKLLVTHGVEREDLTQDYNIFKQIIIKNLSGHVNHKI